MKLAVIGATGLVGREIVKVLEERNLPVSEFIPVASEKSIGKIVEFNGKDYTVVSASEAIAKAPDYAIFSAGGATSLEMAPKFADAGTVVIDNSSAWRMDKNVPLIVPEINFSDVKPGDKIIANPNCSTIQMVMALSPLHKMYNIKRLVISTYQAVSGSGSVAVNQLVNERENKGTIKAYPHQIDLNVLPHAGDFDDDGYTSEEVKLVNETNKILNAYIAITATVVRVPVMVGHSESVNVEFDRDFVIEEVKRPSQHNARSCCFRFPAS